jgi:hypothetical protein
MDKIQHNNAKTQKFLGKMHKKVRSWLTSISDLKISVGRWKNLMISMN